MTRPLATPIKPPSDPSDDTFLVAAGLFGPHRPPGDHTVVDTQNEHVAGAPFPNSTETTR